MIISIVYSVGHQLIPGKVKARNRSEVDQKKTTCSGLKVLGSIISHSLVTEI